MHIESKGVLVDCMHACVIIGMLCQLIQRLGYNYGVVISSFQAGQAKVLLNKNMLIWHYRFTTEGR